MSDALARHLEPGEDIVWMRPAWVGPRAFLADRPLELVGLGLYVASMSIEAAQRATLATPALQRIELWQVGVTIGALAVALTLASHALAARDTLQVVTTRRVGLLTRETLTAATPSATLTRRAGAGRVTWAWAEQPVVVRAPGSTRSATATLQLVAPIEEAAAVDAALARLVARA